MRRQPARGSGFRRHRPDMANELAAAALHSFARRVQLDKTLHEGLAGIRGADRCTELTGWLADVTGLSPARSLYRLT